MLRSLHLTLTEFVYYGVIITILVLYLSLYIKNRHEIIASRRKSTRWSIVASFAVIGIMGVLFKLIAWLPALISSALACLIAYYVIFVKYND